VNQVLTASSEVGALLIKLIQRVVDAGKFFTLRRSSNLS
jgi:hypothetical protein